MDAKQPEKELSHVSNNELILRAKLPKEEWIQKPPHMSTMEWMEHILNNKESSS